MAYATGDDLVLVVDRRDLADLCADSDGATVNPGTVESHPKILDALEFGSARVKGACFIANKYLEADLQTLADAKDALLVRLVCWLAHGELLGGRSVQQGQIPPYIARAEQWVEQLKKGEMLFNVAGNRDKGNVTTGSASVESLAEQGFVTSQLTGRYFPSTSWWNIQRRR